MQQPATYDAYVEIAPDGSALAQLLDLPGCFGRGYTEQEALASLTAAIPVYFAWMERHDDYTPIVAGPHAVTVRERAATPPGAFFSPDAEPVEPGNLDIDTTLLEWAYVDLQAIMRAAPPTHLIPGAEAFARLEDLLRTQIWLVSRLDEHPTPAPLDALPGGLAARLDTISRAAPARLHAATDDECGRILEHGGERWSLAKVLRRSLLLVRETTAWLEGWLGVLK